MSGIKSTRLVLQDRDRHLLSEIAELGVVNREQARILAGFGSRTRVNVRLLALTRTGLLKRSFLGTRTGGREAIYAISKRAALALGLPQRGPRRRNDELLVIDPFVQHQLAVNDFYCIAKSSPTPTADVRFVRWRSFYRPLDSGTSLRPDGYVEYQTASQIIAAFLEMDMGHEGLKVWKAKVNHYLRYALSGHFEKEFGRSRFRVIVIANSERRVMSLRRTTASLTEKIFWFATFASIQRNGLWSAIWQRPKGDSRQSFL